MLYGELGRYPLYVNIIKRLLNFWARLITGKTTKLSLLVYRFLYHEFINGNFRSKWITFVKCNLDQLGMSDVWIFQNPGNLNYFSRRVEQTLKDQFYQKWTSSLQNSSKGRNYALIKSNINIEPYLFTLPSNLRNSITKFRLSNHKLPVETGRWSNIPLQERTCILCDGNNIGDEIHYILRCTYFTELRKKYIPKRYLTGDTHIHFSQLFNSQNVNILKGLSMFSKRVIEHFQQ